MTFHQALGMLFYAIAAADGQVRLEELNTLKKLIEREWIKKKNTQNLNFDDNCSEILKTFMSLKSDSKEDALDYFNRFINYKRANTAFFDENVNALILNTARKITTSFSGQNKSELIMLTKLSLEFKKD